MRSGKKLNRHVSAFITFLALIPLVYFIPDLVGQYLQANRLIRVILAVAIIVPIITYIVMPTAMKLLACRCFKR